MKKPTSHIKAIQDKFDIATDLFEKQTEDEIFWLRWTQAMIDTQKLLNQNQSMRAGNGDEKENPKKDLK